MAWQTATFGAGCFWCLEAAMNQLDGVKQAVSGYMGGHSSDPTYREVCSGNSGHAEVVQLQYDDESISYEQLCLVFFSLHDPTQLNRQGNDVGTQYRSVVFYHDDHQKQVAADIIEKLTEADVYSSAIVTEISPAQRFYAAENEHQGYFLQHPEQGYCQLVVAPKMAKFKRQFSELLKS